MTFSCRICKKTITEKELRQSIKRYNKGLCREHQKIKYLKQWSRKSDFHQQLKKVKLFVKEINKSNVETTIKK